MYPRSHDTFLSFQMSLENASKDTTIIPYIMQDEGLGTPSAVKTNPRHASFAEYNQVNCFPNSTITRLQARISLTLSKAGMETDKITKCRVMIIPIQFAFKEGLEAVDEISSETVMTILEMQKEATDTQAYPLWSGTKLPGDTLDVGTDMPGLTTNTNIESVAFDPNTLYDSLQYFTNGGKVRASIGKIMWKTLEAHGKGLTIKINQVPGSKFQNEYTFRGVLIHVPMVGTQWQFYNQADVTAINHVDVQSVCRYQEWNEHFDFMET